MNSCHVSNQIADYCDDLSNTAERDFTVAVWITIYGEIKLEATSQEDALEKAYEMLEEDGESVIDNVTGVEFNAENCV